MITRRGATFWLDIYVGPKRVRKSLHTTEHAVAIERARDLTLDLSRPRPAGTLIAEFIEAYKTWAKETKPASYATEIYRIAVLKSWLEAEGLLTLEQVSTHHVERFRAYVMTRPVGHTTKTIGRTTANRYLAMLRTMFNKARDWEMYRGDNPVSRVKFYREGNKVRPLSEAEVEAVVAAADALAAQKYATPMFRAFPAICRLVLQTGLRRSEALGLRWADVIDDELRVRGKGGKVRMIPLNAEARAALESTARVGPYVFDVPYRAQSGVLRRVTGAVSKATGVRFHLHLLRHAFASRLLAAGVDVVTISSLLGHSAYMTTLLYAHSNPKLQKEAISRLSHAGAPQKQKRRKASPDGYKPRKTP